MHIRVANISDLQKYDTTLYYLSHWLPAFFHAPATEMGL